MSNKNKMLEPSFFEGTIVEITVAPDGTVSYGVLPRGLDAGTPLTGFKAMKPLKGVYNAFTEGQAVFGIKDPNASTGGFILGGRETAKDNPPPLNDISDFIVSNEFGELSIRDPEKGGISILQNGSGIKINSYNEDTNQLYFCDNRISYNSSGFSYEGKAKFVFEEGDSDIYLSSNFYNKYGFNFNYYKNDTIGEYGGLEARVPGIISSFKNKPVVYNRTVYNHMPNNWQGSDLEFSKIEDISDSIDDSKKKIKSINSKTNFSHNLDLSPNQVGEVIWGNVLDLDGSILDSNYNKIKNYSPITYDSYLTSQELKSRTLAYHFQVSTVNNSDFLYSMKENYIHSINKDGFLYLNVPGTSNTGVIPYEKEISFNEPHLKSRISTKALEPESEDIPIVNHLVISTKYLNSIGEKEVYKKDVSLPNSSNIRLSGDELFKRKGGVGFYSIDSHNKNSDASPRRKMTSHHNMWAACESLFGNLISNVNIPTKDSDDCNLQAGNSYYKSFEIPLRNVVPSATGDSNLPSYMSTVTVSQSKPAVQTGGGVSVCGLTEKEVGHKPLTNDFDYINGKIKLPPSENYTSVGNISGNINFQGSITANIGKDTHDEKSIMLDCAGSMICWLGKDKNNRSAVIQTDGSVSLNVGGRSGSSFNKGRLDIRVNVNDKGTMLDVNEESIDSKQKTDGDYVISISENGLVIAGMNSAPMIIRNNGDLCLEATKDIRFISGGSIIKKEGFSEQADSAENQYASTDKVSPFCDINDII